MKPAVRMIGLTQPYDDPDYEDRLPLNEPRDLIEFAGRYDYGERSIARMGTDPTIIGRWLAQGEESMIEMVDALFLVTCSRVVSHELVRHRIASYQQESQRFVAYEKENPLDLFNVPGPITAEQGGILMDALTYAHEAYAALRATGFPKQLARYVLPNATRTRIVVKMNARIWRHVLRLRLHTSAQPEMREVMALIHAKAQRALGADLFPDDIAAERGTR